MSWRDQDAQKPCEVMVFGWRLSFHRWRRIGYPTRDPDPKTTPMRYAVCDRCGAVKTSHWWPW